MRIEMSHDDVIKRKHFPRYTGGRFCGEFTGDRWIPLTKDSDAELWCFIWSAPWKNGWVNNREAGDWNSIALIMTSLLCDAHLTSLWWFGKWVVVISQSGWNRCSPKIFEQNVMQLCAVICDFVACDFKILVSISIVTKLLGSYKNAFILEETSVCGSYFPKGTNATIGFPKNETDDFFA